MEKFYTAEDVMKILGIGRTSAYKFIKSCNDELKEKGYFTIAGKIPKKYFNERIYGESN